MFFNKNSNQYIYILSLVLLVILSVGAVSASDGEISELTSNSTDSISIDDNEVVLESPSVMSNNVDVPSLRSGSGNSIYVDSSAGAGGDGSITSPYKDLSSALGSSVDGDSIYILPGIYKGLNNNVGLKITKNNLLIIGTGPDVIFDGENTNRIFNITGSNVTIQGITFKNAKADNYGAAIYSDNLILNIKNCSFENCYLPNSYGTTGNYGGAIYVNGNLIVIDSYFVNNTASKGSAIYLPYDGNIKWNMNITNSTFINNNASDEGSAIYTYSYGDLNIINSSFINNYARYLFL